MQAALTNAPPNTTFCFGPGTYSVSSLIPKSGDVLNGEGQTAILDGGHSALNAIYGDTNSTGPSNVTVEGFVVQNYNTGGYQAAVQDYNGSGWIIQNNHIINNNATGVGTGKDVKVLNNLIDHNGQEAFSAHGSGGLYQGNEMSFNNINFAYDATSEAGGGKAFGTTNLTFRDNYVHDNGGNGLWCDTNCLNTTFDSNTISNNWGAGIYYEISYNATITNNTVTNNGMPSSPGGGQRLGWGWDAGIQIRLSQSLNSSSPLLVFHNTVTNNYNGISLLQAPHTGCTGSNEGAYGPCNVRNVLVVDNGITMTQGATGGYQDGAGNGIFTSQSNHFANNHFCVSSKHHPKDGYAPTWLTWMNNFSDDFTVWQLYGNDVSSRYNGGTFKVGGACNRRR